MYELCEQMQELDNQVIDMADHISEQSVQLWHIEGLSNMKGRGGIQTCLCAVSFEMVEVQREEKAVYL
jgi:hypothetical protein